MSDFTYGLIAGIQNFDLIGAARSSYEFIVNDLSNHFAPVQLQFAATPEVRNAQHRLQERTVRLAALTPNVTRASAPVASASARPMATPATLPAVSGAAPALYHQVPRLSFVAPPALASAPPVIRQSFELMARAEATLTRTSLTRQQMALPASPHLRALKAQLANADKALDAGNPEAAHRAAEAAARSAVLLEQDLAQATAKRTAQGRSAADALARAGALWTTLHGQDSLHREAERFNSTTLETIENDLRACRAHYVEGRFEAATVLAQKIEAQLHSVLEDAQLRVAHQQRDAHASEAAEVLRGLGFEVRTELQDEKRVVSASRGGHERINASFDPEGRFELDTRHGYEGAPTCAVEANKVLQLLGEKIRLQVEGRTYVARPDRDGGHSQNRAVRRRLSLSDALTSSARSSQRSAVPPQAAAAWARINR